ncbi:MAG TPA: tRNA lysidine(34) synthetase TilS [Firmicutes bacterium]|nr:tRNA lysidine(34) synthetase TilS [Candidatus Fermentithermobacillaceae bacterium]
MTGKVLDRVRETVRRYRMFSGGGLVLVAVSGGPDSMCLLHVLSRLRRELSIELRVAHLHHHMRREADRDAEMVEEFARSLGIPTTVGHADVLALAREMGTGVEEAGREARYRFFRELRDKTGARWIALGHNQNDQAETVLMRLMRGSGARGLAGISPVNGDIVRPLINVPREWIEDYCREHGIPTMVDSYNLDLKYTRNSVRYKTLPELAALYNPSIVETLASVAESLRLDSDFLDNKAREAFDKYTCRHGRITLVKTDGLKTLHPAIALRVLDMAWKEVSGGDGNLGLGHARKIFEGGAEAVSLPERATAVLQGDFVVFYPEAPRYFERRLDVPGETFVPELGVILSAQILDPPDVEEIRLLPDKSKCANSVPWLEREDVAFLHYEVRGSENAGEVPFCVRIRRPGDRFQPLGMGGKEQKLKDYFTQRRVPKFYRDFVPIISRGDKIAWVGGFRLDERFKVTKGSQKVLRIEVKRSLRCSRNCVNI